MNRDKLRQIIEEYKKVFLLQQWKEEKYKWEAVKHFQDNWDINAENFSEMFTEATNKTYNLLDSMSKYPKAMIRDFADVDPEATRAMFINLFDESKNIFKRIEKFNSDAEAIRSKYGEDKWNNHFQDLNSITTYLWLRYPDKYYIYKYSVYKDVVKELEADSKVKTGISSEVYSDFFDLYNEICEELKSDKALKEMLNSVLTDASYKDPELKTMTIDLCYYLKRTYLVKLEAERIKTLISEEPILKKITSAEDMDPDSHDGSYELMRETVKAYFKVESKYLGIEDLDLVYSMAVGTWKIGISNKKDRIKKSNLPDIEKDRLRILLDKIMEKSINNEYSNGVGDIGMFGTGFMTFNGKSSSADAKKFISLLIEINNLEDDNEIFKIVEGYFKNNISGIQAGAASTMLHCLKPRVFPIINGAALKSIVILEEVGVVLNRGSKLTHYIENTKILKNFREKYCKFKNYRVLDMQLWNVDTPHWFPTKEEYDPQISSEQWIKLLNDKNIFTKDSLLIMARFKDYGGQATCTELSNKYGGEVNFYNAGSSSLAQRVHRVTDCPVMKKNEKDLRWWPILYLGKLAEKEEPGSFIWKLRDELSQALNHIELPEPFLKDEIKGGVQYWWLNASPKIWSYSDIRIGETIDYTLFNSNGNKRRIHQNFLDAKVGDLIIGYETNPIKKIVALGRVVEENDGERIYFEKTEVLVEPIDYERLKEYPELKNMEFFINPNGSLFKVTKEEFDFIMDIVREENPPPKNKAVESYSKEEFLKEVYMIEEDLNTLTSLLKNKKNIILQGAPGVGKTFASKRLAYAIMEEKDENRIEFIQFHQNYSYEDFIMGYKPVGEGFELKHGVFYNFCKKAENMPKEPFFFIIDEINRGNMSKIFGEMLMLIENDYRNKKATLAYNGMPFSVPDNLYIIGMMNTADRSLAMIDYALRRRFSFYEMEPGFDSDGFKGYQRKLNNERFDALIGKVKELNKEISSDSSLGKGFNIGHSYFCEAKECSDEWLRQVVEYDILPMLSEYWFDEPAKLQRWQNILRGIFDD